MHQMSYASLSQECSQNTTWAPQEPPSMNRFIYIKQRTAEKSSHNSSNGCQKVLVNPHFKKNKVFVNPKFTGIQPNTIHVNPHIKNVNVPILADKQYIEPQPHPPSVPVKSTKIHINPNAKNVQIALNMSHATSQTVHINPNFKNPTALNSVLNNNVNITNSERKENLPSNVINKAIVVTRTKLIRTPIINNKIKKKRRNSVKSKYKIVKSSHSPKINAIETNVEENRSKNKYKIDRRKRKSLSIIAKNQKKYVYVNRFFSISDLAKSRVIKNSPASPVKNTSVVNICGVVYRKSRTSLRRASITSLALNKSPSRIVEISEYKLVKGPAIKKASTCKPVPKNQDGTANLTLKKSKVVRKPSPRKNKSANKASPKASLRILRKCNIPCPYFKKYGLCKGKENGKCFRKHDPDQIALCTRFLQGACIKETCLLSHNVSPEKMPTCKYYLEGSCSREHCSYLHVKINPKAKVCRDFLEGFCKKAAECDKRHQYLCPDYEKDGNCLKQRCPYPHGKMVRTYMSNKTKFAKKCSERDNKFTKKDQKLVLSGNSCCKSIKAKVSKNEVVKEKQRYYDGKKSKSDEITSGPTTSGALERPENNEEIGTSTTKNFIGLQRRPKLGTLPAFIPFGK